MKLLVSACLIGVPCRYDGKSVPDENVIALMKDHVLVPVCPETLGGLPTPRVPCERQGYKVTDRDGRDRSREFFAGARLAGDRFEKAGCDAAILKSKSPSCGKGCIYDGTFTGATKKGDGITAEYFIKKGYKVCSEEELAADPEIIK